MNAAFGACPGVAEPDKACRRKLNHQGDGDDRLRKPDADWRTAQGLRRTGFAGVLGKLIGVHLGRPFEGWTNERIERELGEITDYVHERLGKRLLVTDDDISGTLTFVRAFEDYGDSFDIPPRDIGQSWLNYIIEN